MTLLGNRARDLFRAQGPLLVLIGVMVLVFFAQAAFGDEWYDGWMAVPAEIAASWREFRAGEVSPEGGREFGTLVSYAFFHDSFEHLASNMIFFWIFGALISELLGWRWMLLVFGLSAIGGAAVHTLLNRDEFIPMLGASGTVMGFEGAYLGLATRWKLPPPHIWPMSRSIPSSHLALLAVIGVGIDYYAIAEGQDAAIAYGAHVGGFTAGLIAAALVAPRPKVVFGRR